MHPVTEYFTSTKQVMFFLGGGLVSKTHECILKAFLCGQGLIKGRMDQFLGGKSSSNSGLKKISNFQQSYFEYFHCGHAIRL